MPFIVNQDTWLGVLKQLLQLSQRQPKIKGHEDQSQSCASHQSDQLQFVIQAQPRHALAQSQTMRHLQVPRDTLYSAPEFGKIKIFGLIRHAKSNGQLIWLMERQIPKALCQFGTLAHSSFSPAS